MPTQHTPLTHVWTEEERAICSMLSEMFGNDYADILGYNGDLPATPRGADRIVYHLPACRNCGKCVSVQAVDMLIFGYCLEHACFSCGSKRYFPTG